jgi:hypothetical protein
MVFDGNSLDDNRVDVDENRDLNNQFLDVVVAIEVEAVRDDFLHIPRLMVANQVSKVVDKVDQVDRNHLVALVEVAQLVVDGYNPNQESALVAAAGDYNQKYPESVSTVAVEVFRKVFVVDIHNLADRCSLLSLKGVLGDVVAVDMHLLNLLCHIDQCCDRHKVVLDQGNVREVENRGSARKMVVDGCKYRRRVVVDCNRDQEVDDYKNDQHHQMESNFHLHNDPKIQAVARRNYFVVDICQWQ